ncbi:hypothetical protein D3C80_1281750 [compost metagenome]
MPRERSAGISRHRENTDSISCPYDCVESCLRSSGAVRMKSSAIRNIAPAETIIATLQPAHCAKKPETRRASKIPITTPLVTMPVT